jgi:hypothetical protein
VFSGFLGGGWVVGMTTLAPASHRLVTGATLLGSAFVAGLTLLGVVRAWGSERGPFFRSFAVLALGFFGIVGIRLLASDGAELAGRLLTYEYLFLAPIIALAAVRMWDRGRRVLMAVVIAAVVAVFVGNATSGWPAPYEFVPGHFQIDAFESGIDPPSVAAAHWITRNAPPDAQIACEISICTLVNAYGTQAAFPDVPTIYYTPTIDPLTRRTLSERGIDFVIVDERMRTMRPVTGRYFAQETPEQELMAPIPGKALDKFNHSPDIDRVYDGGVIRIYDVRRVPGV